MITLQRKHFFITSLSGFLFFFSFGILIPDLPDIVESISSSEWKGLGFTFFSLFAILSRPFAGRLIDKIGLYRTIKFGLCFSIVASIFYPLYYSIFFLLFIRSIHGISKGIVPTAMTGLIADMAPADQRGKLLGHYSIATSMGIALGPAIGGTITYYYGLNALFFVGIISITSSFLVALMHSNKIEKMHKDLTIKDLKITTKDFLLKDVLAISFVQWVFAFEHGVSITLIPTLNDIAGVSNNGIFFIYYAVASIGIRFFTSDLSDKYGRDKSLILAGTFYGLTVLLFVLIKSELALYAVSICYGIARGLIIPIMFGQLVDRITPNNRGRALSTFFFFMELGTALGSFFGSFFTLPLLYIPFIFTGSLILLTIVYWKNSHAKI